MELLDLLGGISPWWWVAFGIALGAFEMATMSFFLIWPAMAAILVAVMLVVSPATSGELQIVVFAIGSIVLTFTGRYFLNRFGDGGENTGTLNSRSTLMVGRHAEVLAFTGPEGHVSIDGVRWRARWPAGAIAEVGQQVQIAAAEGMTLLVSEAE